ncbi:MAG: hypothetical protein IKR25_01810 [Muribaculaceae bacterium]|nr:hypothetical protein [Muribaculaceae bacterium]
MGRRKHDYDDDDEIQDDDLSFMYDVMFDEDCDPDEDMSGEAIFGD